MGLLGQISINLATERADRHAGSAVTTLIPKARLSSVMLKLNLLYSIRDLHSKSLSLGTNDALSISERQHHTGSALTHRKNLDRRRRRTSPEGQLFDVLPRTPGSPSFPAAWRYRVVLPSSTPRRPCNFGFRVEEIHRDLIDFRTTSISSASNHLH
ncbi:hypothetical protein EJ06DRAFT_250167 [Trichodelitschia bisporula]|uniref:Uncharacterized protein n=1 Tax=Trichodelitschia bisporula TaxID=703511 RepID=A0A6G1HJR4_9PEZI|nr:hypothetical protein EJ06DRAFT_250167 [Trichodelitschia bisporula]